MRYLCAILLLSACSDVQDHFFVRRADADLPAWLQGDQSAETFVLVTHGSGATGRVYDWMPAFDALEEDHAFIYWDQRVAGNSQGNGDATNLTESVADLGAVLRAVRARYAPERVVLLGHSLGGGISQAFLRDPARASGVAGYVDVSGARNVLEAYQDTAARMTEEARRLAAEQPEDAAFWNEMLAFYEDTPAFPRFGDKRFVHAANVERVACELGFDQRASTAEMGAFLQGKGLEGTLFGSFDAFAYGQNTAEHLSRYDLDGVAMTPADVATIDVPALVLAGRFDFAVPVPVSEASFAAFGAQNAASRLVVLDDAGHFAMWDQPAAFTAAVGDFLNSL